MSVARILALAAVVAAGALSVVVPAQAATPLPDAGTVFTPVSPTRIFDSRDSSKIPAHGTVAVSVPTSLVPADATAVVFNLTGTDPAGPTWLAEGPGTHGTPTTSSLNLAAGETRANLVTVALGHGDNPGIWVGAGPNAVDAIVDIAGYYSPTGGSKFTPVGPQRVLDTRNSAPLGPGGTVTLDLSSQAPASATAVVFNLTGTDVTGDTFVTAYPSGTPRPNASNLNLVAGKDIPNLVTVRLGADRKVSLTNAHSSADLVVDFAGYYSADSTQAFFPLLPGRVLDTRNADGTPRNALQAGETRPLNLMYWAPPGATAAVVNMTATNVTGNTVLTVWAHGAPQPGVSNLNLLPGQTSANAVITPLNGDRALDIRNREGRLDAIVDLAGYFAPALPACATKCVIGSGANEFGQAGVGTTDSTTRADSRVYGLSGVTAIANTDQDAYAIDGSGTLWSWGRNDRGQLGIGFGGNAEGPLGQGDFEPLPVAALTGIKSITPGMALTTDGSVYTWGTNESLQLGNGNTDTTAWDSGPKVVLSNVIAIAENRNGNAVTRYALKSNGTVWSWGDGSRGALGNNTNDVASAVPVQVFGLSGCTGLGVRVVLCPGSVWRWGAIGSGQQLTPAGLPLPDGQIASVQRDNGVNSGARALMADGTVWQWPDGASFTGTFQGAAIAGLSSITQLATGHALDHSGGEWTLTGTPTQIRVGVSAIGDGSYYVSTE
ncbi:RCC1 domain-containing protein [Kutzneria sp. NPDC052558]|uniref:RCC1 domain-containing protein n=1 Tax=Kutzneria sp. NPDC052558 TaxID=3364121 RepID=UPI0037CB4658